MAVMHRPALLIADEATSALDVITQAEILQLFASLNRETGMSILYISHDLPSVAGICQRIAILNEGEIVECGPTAQIFAEPVHPYTRRLMSALPQIPPRPGKLASQSANCCRQVRRAALKGSAPSSKPCSNSRFLLGLLKTHRVILSGAG